MDCTVFLGTMDDYAGLNAAWVEAFTKDPPARAAFGASGLAMGAAAEVVPASLTFAPIASCCLSLLEQIYRAHRPRSRLPCYHLVSSSSCMLCLFCTVQMPRYYVSAAIGARCTIKEAHGQEGLAAAWPGLLRTCTRYACSGASILMREIASISIHLFCGA